MKSIYLKDFFFVVSDHLLEQEYIMKLEQEQSMKFFEDRWKRMTSEINKITAEDKISIPSSWDPME